MTNRLKLEITTNRLTPKQVADYTATSCLVIMVGKYARGEMPKYRFQQIYCNFEKDMKDNQKLSDDIL